MKTHLLKFWKNSCLWEEYSVNDKDHSDRLGIIKNIIPQNINTVVDIGCGKGDVIQAIEAKTKIALDISETALSYIKDETVIKIQADISEKIPDKLLFYKETGIDLLICLEVIEHLPCDILNKAVKNILNIQPKFLLIGVPYREPLGKRSIKCKKCGQFFNMDTHLRNFSDKQDVIKLFEDNYTFKTEAYAGKSYLRFPNTYYIIKNMCTGTSEKYAVCYHCGDTNDSWSNGACNIFINYVINKIERLLSVFAKKQPYWMLLLLQRKTKIPS